MKAKRTEVDSGTAVRKKKAEITSFIILTRHID